MNGQVITNLHLKILMNRGYKAVPTYTAPILFKVGTGTTTPLITDTDLETPVDITAGVQTKAFVSGYPTFDESSFNVTIRSLLLTTDANGNSLTEVGIVNTDGTAKLSSHAVYTAITKNTSTQVVFIEKHKLSV